MTCDPGTNILLIMGDDRRLEFAVKTDTGAVKDLTGLTASATAIYDNTTLTPTVTIPTPGNGIIRVVFAAAQLTTIGVGKTVTLAMSLHDANDVLIDHKTATCLTAYG